MKVGGNLLFVSLFAGEDFIISFFFFPFSFNPRVLGEPNLRIREFLPALGGCGGGTRVFEEKPMIEIGKLMKPLAGNRAIHAELAAC